MGLDGIETPKSFGVRLRSNIDLIDHLNSDNLRSKRAEAVVSQGEDRRGNEPARVTPNSVGDVPAGADICDEPATRREGGQPPGHRWHTLVS